MGDTSPSWSPSTTLRHGSQERWDRALFVVLVAGARPDITMLTPDDVRTHRDALGIPEAAPIEDFFYEFLSRRLVTQDIATQNPSDPSRSEAEQARLLAWQALLQSWGYAPVLSASQEISDPETGLYMVRVDPLAGADRPSILVIRGTESVLGRGISLGDRRRALRDVLSDLGPAVGASQYEANAEAIAALLEGGTPGVVVTGHSLGGHLAQRIAAAHPAQIGSVVTFQAGGIDKDHAAWFEKANAAGQIAVRHHQTHADVVHLLGEERLEGLFFQHNAERSENAHAAALMYNDADILSLSEQSGAKTIVTTTVDPVPRGQRCLAEGLRVGVGGMGQAAGAPLVGLWELGVGLAHTGASLPAGQGPLMVVWVGLGGLGQALWRGVRHSLSAAYVGGQQLHSAGENLLEASRDGLGRLWGRG